MSIENMTMAEAASLAERIARKDYEAKKLRGRKPKISKATPDTIMKEMKGKIPRFWVCSFDFSQPGKLNRDKVGIVTIDLVDERTTNNS